MDLYDKFRKSLEKFDQKKLLINTIIGASLLILLLIFFLIYVNKRANEGKHVFGPADKVIEERKKEEEERQKKILEDPETKELYDKYIINRDLSF